jgi:hypothetical protein
MPWISCCAVRVSLSWCRARVWAARRQWWAASPAGAQRRHLHFGWTDCGVSRCHRCWCWGRWCWREDSPRPSEQPLCGAPRSPAIIRRIAADPRSIRSFRRPQQPQARSRLSRCCACGTDRSLRLPGGIEPYPQTRVARGSCEPAETFRTLTAREVCPGGQCAYSWASDAATGSGTPTTSDVRARPAMQAVLAGIGEGYRWPVARAR